MRRNFGIRVMTVLVMGLIYAGSGDTGTQAQSASRCPAFPSFPDASCTGTLPGVTRGSSGTIVTSSNGQVIQNLNITGHIQVNHSNVTIRNVRITFPNGINHAAISIEPGAVSTVIEDCELDGTGNTAAGAAVIFGSYTIRRCNIHHYGEGLTAEGNVLIEDNYLHDFLDFVAGGAHQDGIQNEFSSNVTMRHNTCLMNVNGANSCFVNGNHGGVNNIIEKNLVRSHASYAIRSGGQSIVRDNRFSTTWEALGGYWGAIEGPGPGAFQSKCGNRWLDGPNAGQLLSGETACAGGSPEPPPPTAPTAPSNLRIISS